MRHSFCVAVCAIGGLSAPNVLAGGYIAPIADPVVVAPVVDVAPASDWAGGYVGGSLGYAFGADDEIGFDLYENDTLIGRGNDLGKVDVKGPTAGVHSGYRWQRGNWVFGPELWIEGGSVDATDTVGPNAEVEVESAVNYLVGLHLKTGYAVNPQTLVYGTAGAVYGDLDYTLSTAEGSGTVNYDNTGYTLGLGVERKVRDNLAVFAELQYRDLGETDMEFVDNDVSVLTRATPEHHHVKLGVNFSF